MSGTQGIPQVPAGADVAEHRARGLLNVATLAAGCAAMADLGEDERAYWSAAAARALEELRPLWPDLPPGLRRRWAHLLEPQPPRP